MSPDSSTTPRADGDGTGPVPAKAAASLRGRAVLVVGCRGRMGAMLCRRGKAAGLDMRGVDVPLTDAVLAPACKDAALALLCVPAAVFADVAATVCAHLPATAILADITSVKVRPLQQMEAIWPGPVVGTHPLFGPATPDEDGLPVTVTPGRTVREGQNVTLTVSLGTQYVTVPDLTNYVQADAEQQLKELGVSVLVTQAVDTSVASGAVIRTDPAAGSQVAAGSTVVMYISRPQVATTTKVPSLTGMSTADARTLLVQNHLGLGSQTEQYSDQPVGTVISQNPAAGSTTKLNGRVNIVVSAGPEPAPEPEAPSDSTTGGDWWSGLFGSSSSSSSTETGTEQGTAGSGDPSQKPLTDWWSSLLS